MKIDCQMGAWQAWYAVQGSPGDYARRRETLVHPLNGGKECPPCTEYKKGIVRNRLDASILPT